jgi:hypothetical protein
LLRRSAFNSADKSQFYGFSGTIPAATSISSFTVLVTLTSGRTQTFDNNGNGYPISDKIFAQTSFSSLAAADGLGNQLLTVFAAVRTTDVSEPVNLSMELVNPLTFNNLPTITVVPQTMTRVCAGKYYIFYSSTFNVPAVLANATKYGVSASANGATVSDSFNSVNSLPALAASTPSCNATSSKRAVNFSA